MESTYIYEANPGWRPRLAEGLRDVVEGARMWPTWILLAWRDFRNQTRRTTLGSAWSVIGLLITAVALGYVYSALLNLKSSEVYPFVVAGLTAWFFIAGSIQGGCSTFINDAGIIKERALPLSFSVFRYTFRMFFEMILKLVAFVVVAAATGLVPTGALVLLPCGLALLLLNGLWATMLFGVVGARYRDVPELIAPLMLIAFLATPVLWPQVALQSSEFIASANPFTHYIAMIRDPLLGTAFPATSLAVVICLTIAGWAAALAALSYAKDRLVYWL